MAVANFDTAAAGSTARPREICQGPAAIAPNSATYCTARAPGTCTPTMTLTKPISRSSGDRADHAQQRQRAALPRGLRRAEKGVGEDDEGERIERGRQAIVQFRAVLVRAAPRRARSSGRGHISSQRYFSRTV